MLSACETGVGKDATGDGVYGLRRALVMAGAESQVMSLWQVDDRRRAVLMTAYYTALKAGATARAALRDVQLEMLRSSQAQPSVLLGELHPVGRRRADRLSVTR